SLTKGIERDTLMRMSEVAAEGAGVPGDRVAVLSGPNLAKEVAKGLPGASVIACSDEARAHALQRLFHAPTFRVYTNTDVCGVETGGATKNVVAIAAGVADGLGYGENALAALVTRGLVEITRLGVRLGADPLTFAGLAGVREGVGRRLAAGVRQRPASPPLYASATFIFGDIDDFASGAETKVSGGCLCSRWANPTVDALGHVVSSLEGADATACFASGMGAIAGTLFSLLRSGDHIVAAAQLYGGTHGLFGSALARAGVSV